MARRETPPTPRLFIGTRISAAELRTNPLDAVLAEFRRNALRAAEIARGAWVAYAQGLNFSRSGDYVDGIRARGTVNVVRDTGVSDTGVAEIVIDITNTSKHAHVVEVGHAAYSLPEAIDWATAPKAKVNKKGEKYLSVPFRHAAYAAPSARATQGTRPHTLGAMMPEAVYKQAKALARTIPNRVGPVLTKEGRFVQADTYQHGGRLSHTAKPGSRMDLSRRPGDAGLSTELRREAAHVGVSRRGDILGNVAWKSSKFDGLFKSGPKGHTSYMTIRTLKQNSRGWRIPAQAGKHIVRTISQSIEHGELMPVMMAALTAGARTAQRKTGSGTP